MENSWAYSWNWKNELHKKINKKARSCWTNFTQAADLLLLILISSSSRIVAGVRHSSTGTLSFNSCQYWSISFAAIVKVTGFYTNRLSKPYYLSLLPLIQLIIYLRWCSLYLEDMQNLPETAPGVHQAFMEGKFPVQWTKGHFKAVGADMALEQTINKSQKGTSGIIDNSRKKQFVAMWGAHLPWDASHKLPPSRD